MTTKIKHIVIIEDDPVLRELIQMVLSLDGHEVDMFENGVEGIKYLENNLQSVGLILLDLYMPVLDGMQVLNWLRITQKSSIKVVVMTAMLDAITEKSLLDSGANKVIEKPLDMDTLLTSINEFLNI